MTETLYYSTTRSSSCLNSLNYNASSPKSLGLHWSTSNFPTVPSIPGTVNFKRTKEISLRTQGAPSALSNILNCSSKKDCFKSPNGWEQEQAPQKR